MAKKKSDPTDKLLDDLLMGKKPEEILGSEGVLKDLTKRLVERALEAEMTEHLGYERHDTEGKSTGNSRTCASRELDMTARLQRDLLRGNVISTVDAEKLVAREQRVAVAT